MKETYHSEYLTLESVYLKTAKNSFQSEKYLANQWKALKYLSKPNYEKALQEYEIFNSFFTGKNIQTCFFPSNEKVLIDSMYCRDASIATDFGIIICNMGKKGRINEPMAQLEIYQRNNIKVLGEIKSPGTLEGGDVAWLDNKTLAVGHSYRTNEEGIRQLKALLTPKGVEVLIVELPHYKGKEDVFHLMSILSPIDKDLAVVYSPLMPIKFRNELVDRGFQLIEVPKEEFDSLGCNVLAVAPRDCLMIKGNPKTQKLLEESGCHVVAYKGNEISLKGGGGPTCLTRPMRRMFS
ncbi:MAG: N(G),N(G)-dimethylarginine dimethylaminohydrolase [Flavobacterium sp. SCGC AAA160-P02]|nr:MAG: N(G),N(G)-dimethylarginine dimethylaminohydrolase [Flavobacterium sp. SCGC AAA160-P02]